jgi:hypothetical protein
MVPPTTSSPTENCLLYGDIVDVRPVIIIINTYLTSNLK